MRGPVPSPRWRVRALTIAVAAAGIVAVTFAGPAQPREWVVQSVNDISKQVGIPAGSDTPSPSEKSTSSGAKEPSGTGLPQATHKATVEPSESPEAEGTTASGPAEGQPSPTPGDGGDDHSPEPSPSN